MLVSSRMPNDALELDVCVQDPHKWTNAVCAFIGSFHCHCVSPLVLQERVENGPEVRLLALHSWSRVDDVYCTSQLVPARSQIQPLVLEKSLPRFL